jgi:tripartite-type tricarboxylate transporter receptor subunit TctC
MNRRRVLQAGLSGLLVAAGPARTWGQSAYPDKPVKFINAFPAGGPSDVFIRAFAQRLSVVLGVPMVVDNRVGAGGAIGSREVAQSRPDGYTLQIATSSSLIIYPLSTSTPMYDPVSQFTPIAELAKLSATICASPSLPVRSLREFVNLLKADPTKYPYGSAGNGSFVHLAAELFKKQAGVESLHVPFKGSAPAMTALLGDQVAWICDVPSTSLRQHESGRIRILALCDDARSKALPNVPTAIEEGFPQMVANTFNFFVAPAGTPRSIVDTLNKAAVRVMNQEDFLAQLRAQGVEPITNATPERTEALIKAEIARWAPIVRATIKE